jgi:carbamoyl-phosphate synthase small subunit
MNQALVVLADGTFFAGTAFGATGTSVGEVVFNTSMTGYQEILTDPSYRGQLVTMTSPQIGNYGVNELDVESDRVQVAGLIVRQASRVASNYRATATLHEYLQANGTVAITGVDTRALTRIIRDRGATMGAIAHDVTAADVPAIVARIQSSPRYEELDYVAMCSVRTPRRVMLTPTGDRYCPFMVRLVDLETPWPAESTHLPSVAVLDYGVKFSILRNLATSGFRVTVYPHDTPASEILAHSPDGVLLSNGPGDPARMDAQVDEIRQLFGHQPIFGICLGHQLLGRALGGTTYKLKYGHRGPNQPVLEESTGRVQITAQNHGYAVLLDNPAYPVKVTHSNLNDRTIEGLEAPSLHAFSVQHHPEAGPGPHDAFPMFAQFRAAVDSRSR